MRGNLSIVHLSLTPLAGSPIRIVNGLNQFSNTSSRLIVLDPNNSGTRTFDNDLCWAEDKEECLALLRDCDIVHLHHFMHLEQNPFGIDLTKCTKRGTKFIHQFQSTPGFLARRLFGGDPEIIKEMVYTSPIPQLVIPHLQERFYPRARIVPQIIPIDEELYTPLTGKSDQPRIVFSPSVSMSAWFSDNPDLRWESKGYPETKRLLERVTASLPGSSFHIIQDTPHRECLELRRKGHIAIDEMVTGSFHLCSFESLAQGLPTFAFLDGRTLDVLAELTGTRLHPWMNFRIEDSEKALKTLLIDSDLRNQISEYSHQWMVKYWNPKSMVQHYVRAYLDLFENPESFAKMRFDPSNRRQMWYIRESFDTVWEKRVQTGREGISADSVKFDIPTGYGQTHREFTGNAWTSTEEILLSAPQPICIVGNGDIRAPLGSLIDSYATIIRMNNYRIRGFEAIVGSKTSFRCVSGWNDVENRNELVEFSPFTSVAKESANLDNYNQRNIKRVISASCDVHPFITEVPNPSTGFALIQLFDMLDIPVDLFGFDAFQTGHYWESEKLETSHSNLEIDYILKRRNIALGGGTLRPSMNTTNVSFDEYFKIPWHLFIKQGYKSRSHAKYFEDTDEINHGAVWQPDIYMLADTLASHCGCKTIIDVGCGHAEKLIKLRNDYNIIGIDYGPNIEFCRNNHKLGTWIHWDFELPACPPVEKGVIAQSLIICSDVIEHLVDPRNLLRYLKHWLEYAPAAIISTPERELTRGVLDFGPPQNAAHVREWSMPELQKLLNAAGIGISYCGLTRSNDIDNRKETIACVLQKTASADIAQMVEIWLQNVKPVPKRIGLFGASSRGKQYLERLSNSFFEPFCFFDNDSSKWGSSFEDLPVFAPDSDHLESVDLILISSAYSAEIREQLKNLGYENRILMNIPEVAKSRSMPNDMNDCTILKAQA